LKAEWVELGSAAPTAERNDGVAGGVSVVGGADSDWGVVDQVSAGG
jgi:hypothetical protein